MSTSTLDGLTGEYGPEVKDVILSAMQAEVGLSVREQRESDMQKLGIILQDKLRARAKKIWVEKYHLSPAHIHAIIRDSMNEVFPNQVNQEHINNVSQEVAEKLSVEQIGAGIVGLIEDVNDDEVLASVRDTTGVNDVLKPAVLFLNEYSPNGQSGAGIQDDINPSD